MFAYFIFLSLLTYSKALNDEQGKKLFIEEVKTCSRDTAVDEDDISELVALKVPTKAEVKCALACTYRVLGVLNKNGMYDLQRAYDYAELMKDGDEKRLENGKKVADLCLQINDVAVTDGEKGCDRAALMFKCLVEEAPKFGFKLI